MEENEKITTVTEEAEEIPEETPEGPEETPEGPEEAPEVPENAEATAEEAADTREEAPLSAEDFARVLANPMFVFFARGRGESAEKLAREFEKMLMAGRSAVSEDDMMKMTPSAGFAAAGGVALSERQRKIARDAGMSYREYYEIISAIPAKTK